MDVPSMEALAARIDRLERENSWLKRVGAVAMVGLLALVALGTDVIRRSRAVTADSFVLKDAGGRPRAVLAMRPEGPSLRFLDAEGRDQVAMHAGEDGSSALEIFDGRALKASLAHTSGVGSALTLLHRGSRGAAEMFMGADGASGLALNRGRRGLGLNVDKDGMSRLSFLDRTGEARTGMALSPEGALTTPGRPHGTADDSARVTHAADDARDDVQPRDPAKSKASRVIAPAPTSGSLGKRTFGSS